MKGNKRRILIKIVFLTITFLVVFTYQKCYGSGVEQVYEVREYILTNHYEQTGAKNAVTAIYLNYRLWDTLFEAMILLLSASAVITFSWRSECDEE